MTMPAAQRLCEIVSADLEYGGVVRRKYQAIPFFLIVYDVSAEDSFERGRSLAGKGQGLFGRHIIARNDHAAAVSKRVLGERHVLEIAFEDSTGREIGTDDPIDLMMPFLIPERGIKGVLFQRAGEEEDLATAIIRNGEKRCPVVVFRKDPGGDGRDIIMKRELQRQIKAFEMRVHGFLPDGTAMDAEAEV